MIIEVRLFDKAIASVEWNDTRGCSVFQYRTEALNRGLEPSPVIMPLQERIFETNRDHINFHHLPYLLSDSLPDDFGHRMMKEWLKRKKISIEEISPVDRLSYVGTRGMGALEYEPVSDRGSDTYEVSVSDLYEIAKKVLDDKKDTSFPGLDKDRLSAMLRIGTSAGGARAKALIALKTGSGHNIQEISPLRTCFSNLGQPLISFALAFANVNKNVYICRQEPCIR